MVERFFAAATRSPTVVVESPGKIFTAWNGGLAIGPRQGLGRCAASPMKWSALSPPRPKSSSTPAAGCGLQRATVAASAGAGTPMRPASAASVGALMT